MHSLCPVQKRIENYFARLWWKGFSQKWQLQTKRVSSGKTISDNLWEYMLSSTAHFIRTFPRSLGD